MASNSDVESFYGVPTSLTVSGLKRLPYHVVTGQEMGEGETRTEADTSAPLHPIFAGIQADIAVRGWKTRIQRINYHVTLIGKIRFAAVIIT